MSDFKAKNVANSRFLLGCCPRTIGKHTAIFYIFVLSDLDLDLKLALLVILVQRYDITK